MYSKRSSSGVLFVWYLENAIATHKINTDRPMLHETVPLYGSVHPIAGCRSAREGLQSCSAVCPITDLGSEGADLDSILVH